MAGRADGERHIVSLGLLESAVRIEWNCARGNGVLHCEHGEREFRLGQTFPGTGNGTVTNVATGAGLTGGPITGTGTISIPSAGVTNTMLANPSVTITAGAGLSCGGTVALGNTITLTTNT